MAVLLKDVAAKAGVSLGLASSVINDTWRDLKVSRKARNRVMAAITEMDYVPNLNAQSLRRGRTLTLGMVVTNVQHPFVALLMQGAQAKAREHSYHIITGVTFDDPAQERFYFKAFRARRVDGLLIHPSPGGDTKDDLIELGQAYPVVLCLPPFESKLDSVVGDTETGIRSGLEYLFTLGHKRIAFVCGHFEWLMSQKKYESYRHTLNKNGLPIENDLLIKLDSSDMSSGREAAQAILALKQKPDAILCSNDDIAFGLMSALLRAGVRIPRDLSLVGLGDVPIARSAPVPLTTLGFPSLEAGRVATQMLLKKLESQRRGEQVSSRTIRLPYELVIRASTAPRNRQS